MCVSVVGHGRTTVESIKLSQTTPTHLKFTRNPGTQGQPVGGARLLRQSASVACSTERRPETLKWERGGGVLFWMVPLDLGWKSGKGQSCGSPGCCQHVLQSGSQAVSTQVLSTDLLLAHGRPKAKDLSVNSELSGQRFMNAIEMKGSMACRLLSLKLLGPASSGGLLGCLWTLRHSCLHAPQCLYWLCGSIVPSEELKLVSICP